MCIERLTRRGGKKGKRCPLKSSLTLSLSLHSENLCSTTAPLLTYFYQICLYQKVVMETNSAIQENSWIRQKTLSFSPFLSVSLSHTHTHTTRAYTHIYRHPKGNSSLAHPILNSALTQSEGGTLAPLRGQSCKVVETETSCPTSPLALTLGTWAVAIIPHGPPDPEPPPQAHALRRDKRAPVAMYLTGQFFLNQGKVPWVCVACTAPGIPSSVLVTAFQE